MLTTFRLVFYLVDICVDVNVLVSLFNTSQIKPLGFLYMAKNKYVIFKYTKQGKKNIDIPAKKHYEV
jgi:hypothetical protein